MGIKMNGEIETRDIYGGAYAKEWAEHFEKYLANSNNANSNKMSKTKKRKPRPRY